MPSKRFPHTVGIEPLSASGNKQVYGASVDVDMFVQPLDVEDALQADGTFNKNLKAYAPIGAALAEGSRATFDSKKYIVTSINKYNTGFSNLNHLKCILVTIKDGE